MIRNRKLIYAAGTIIILLIIGLLFSVSSSPKKTAIIDVEVAPTGSVLKLNEKGVKNGPRKVAPGTYTLTASRSGFDSGSIKLTIKDSESRVMGLVLQSNSSETKDWYKIHPSDALLAESITGRKFDQASDDSASRNPLLTKLPFIGAGFEFRIDYGKSKQGKTDPAIYIRATTSVAQNDALLWIKSQGFDASKMEIIMINESPANAGNSTSTAGDKNNPYNE